MLCTVGLRGDRPLKCARGLGEKILGMQITRVIYHDRNIPAILFVRFVVVDSQQMLAGIFTIHELGREARFVSI